MKITIDKAVLERVLNAILNAVPQTASQAKEQLESLLALREALAQPQQEPVAVVDDAGVIVVCSYKYKPGDKLYTSPPERNRQSGRGQQMNDENKNLYAFPIGTADHEYHRKMIADAKVALTSAAKHLRHGDTLGASLALQPVEKTLDALSVSPHPAQPSKPLTDELIIGWVESGEYNVTTNDWASHIAFARAIEEAHGIKESK